MVVQKKEDVEKKGKKEKLQVESKVIIYYILLFMANNPIEFFTIRTLQINETNNKFFEGNAFYANTREDAIKQLKNFYQLETDGKTYCLIYKTMFTIFNNSDTLNDLKKDIGAISTSVNLILEQNLKERNQIYKDKDDNRYQIVKFIYHFSKNGENVVANNPVIIICRKNDKIYAYEPEPIKITDNQKFRSEIKQRNDLYKSKDFIEEKLKESEKYFGAFLLEEYIKDELKGLGTKLAKEKIKKLEEEKKKVQQDLLKVNIERLESFIKDQIKITGYKKSETKDKAKLLELGAKRLEKEVIDKLKTTALELKNNRLEEEIANANETIVFLDGQISKSSLDAGVAKLENFITNQLTNVGKDLQIAKLQSYVDLFRFLNPIKFVNYVDLQKVGLDLFKKNKLNI